MKRLITVFLIIITCSVFSYSQSLSFKIDSVSAVYGDSVIVPINITNFTDVGSFTLYIEYNNSIISWGRGLNWHPDIVADAPLINASNGIIALAFANVNGLSLSDGKLLDLKFLYNGTSSTLNFTSSCEVTDNLGIPLAVNPEYINGVVVPRIEISLSTSNAEICLLDSAQLTATVSGGFGNTTYSWTSEPLGFTSSIPNPKVSPAVATTYTLVADDGYDTDTATVFIDIIPAIQPGVVSNMMPVQNEIGLDIPVSFSWMPGANSTMYDVYIWETGTAVGLPHFANTENINLTYSSLQFGTSYNWKVNAKNACLSTMSQTQVFETRFLPDLEVSNILTPSTIYAGQNLAVSWTVFNSGPGGTHATTWKDATYLSADTILDNSDILLGKINNLSALDTSESYVNSHEFTIPVSIFGNYYVIVKADVDNSLIETNELNNYLFDQSGASLSVTLPPQPDLVCSSIGVPTSIISGSEITLTYTVENTGFAPAMGSGLNSFPSPGCSLSEHYWYDAILISDDSIFPIYNSAYVGDNYIGLRSHELGINYPCFANWYDTPDYLDVDSLYTMNYSFTIPHYYYGTYYIFVYTDRYGYVSELASNNNIKRSAAINVTLKPPPNLVVDSVTIPATANSGSQVTVNWTTENIGANAPVETSWRDKVYISQLDTFNQTYASLVGTEYVFNGNNLFPYDTYNKSLSFNLPQNISGQYYIYVYTDKDNDVFEYTFDNDNVTRSVTAINISLSPYPDLVITNISLGTISNAGDTVPISWTVKNQGLVAASGSWSDRVYVSSSQSWLGNASFGLLTLPGPGALDTSESYTRTHDIIIPENISGTVYIYVYTDYSNQLYEYTFENNNVENAGYFTDTINIPPVVIEPDTTFCDLFLSSLNTPASAYSGASVSISWIVENIGTDETTGNYWYDRVYLSSDSLWDYSDILLTTLTHSYLGIGNSYTKLTDIEIPNGISGSYYLLAYVDVYNAVNPELSETNNSGISPIEIIFSDPPDLVFDNVLAPSSALAGQTINIQYTVANNGNGQTAEDLWFDRIYLSTTPDATSGWTHLLSVVQHNSSLAANGLYTENLSINLSSSYVGFFYLVFVTDESDLVYEYNSENNNETYQLINITQPLPCDLVISSISAPDSVVLGDNVVINYSLVNNGGNPALGNIRDAFYFSEDSIFDGAIDKILGYSDNSIVIQPGDTLSATISNITPAVTPGNYLGIGRTNILNSLIENNYDNNNIITDDSINVSIEELILDVVKTTGLDQGDYKYYKIDVAADLDLLINVTSTVSNGSNEVYVAYERVPAPYDFDFIFENPQSVNQQVLIPSTSAGTYYVLIRTQTNYYGLQDIDILAQALPFSIISINPDTVGQDIVTTSIRGAGFQSGTQFYIYDNGSQISAGTITNFINSMKVDIQWDFENVPENIYDIVAVNPDTTITYPYGIYVEPSTGFLVDYNYIAPDLLRIGGTGSFTFYFVNIGNVDIPFIKADITIPNYSNLLSINTSNDVILRNEFVDIPNEEIPYFVDNGNSRVIPVIYKDLQPGDIFTVSITVNGFQGNTFSLRTRALGYDKESFIFSQLSLAENLRWSMYNHPNLFTATQDLNMMALLSDCEIWRDTVLNQMVSSSLINIDDTIGMDISCETLSESIGESLVPVTLEGDFTFSPGNSPGTMILPFTSFESGDDYLWEINKYNGTAGMDPGWDLLEVSGAITVNSTNLNPFVVRIASLNAWNEPDYLDGWYPAVDKCWPIAIAGGGFINFDPSKIALDISRFTDYNQLYGGTFSLQLQGTDTLLLCFTAHIPGIGEPGVPGAPGGPGHVGSPGGKGGPGGIGILPGPGGVGGIGGPGITEIHLVPGNGGQGGDGGDGIAGQNGGQGGDGGQGGTGGTGSPEMGSDGGNGGPGGHGGAGGAGGNGGPGGNGGQGGNGGAGNGGQGGPGGPGGSGGSGGSSGPGGGSGSPGNPGSSNPGGPGGGGFNSPGGGFGGPGGGGSNGFGVPCNSANQGQKICDAVFKATGCGLALIGCATFETGIGAIICIYGIGSCVGAFNSPVTLGGVDLLGCIDEGLAGPINCAGQYICNQVVKSCDPNDIIGPAGYGEGNYVAQFETLPYMIRFENDSTFATASAQRVEVHMPIPSTLNPFSFRLKEFGFGLNTFPAPENASSSYQLIDMPDSLGYDVQYTAGIDIVNNDLFWVFQTIDPATGLPPTDAATGFLSVNDSLGNGEGFVSFTINPASSTQTGDSIFAEAEIIFDINDPINTPRIFNIIDAGKPTSIVAALPEVSDTTTILIDFIGSDDIGGSGIAKYRLYVSEENGPWEFYNEFNLNTQATFTGVDETTYSFFSRAVDNVGNIEGMKDYAETTTIINPSTLSLGGLVTYDNNNNSPLQNVSIIVSDSTGAAVDTSISDVNGNYYFPSLIPGTYQISASSNAEWGGGNATDALIISKFTVGTYSLTAFRQEAADVNLSSSINSTDGLLVKRRTIGIINSFPSGDWLFDADSVNLNGNLVYDITGLCYGDLNGSLVQPGNLAKSYNSNVQLLNDGEIYTSGNSEFIVNIRVHDEYSFNALTLLLEYNPELMEFKGLSSDIDGIMHNSLEGEIRIAWESLSTKVLNEDDVLVRLRFITKETDIDCVAAIEASVLSEFADKEAQLISDVKLYYPEINILKDGEFSLSNNFPNPFNENTSIVYVLPEDGIVTLKIYNSLGEYVSTVISEKQKAGSYTVNFNRGNLASGVYQYKIIVNGTTRSYSKTKMMVINN